jgi:hypothetical protein
VQTTSSPRVEGKEYCEASTNSTKKGLSTKGTKFTKKRRRNLLFRPSCSFVYFVDKNFVSLVDILFVNVSSLSAPPLARRALASENYFTSQNKEGT